MIKYFKQSVFILSTIPFLIITYKIFFKKLGPEPVKEITHFTGEWTLIFICLTLSMSPLKKLTNFLDKKYAELRDRLGNIGENKLLLITTIQLIDEYFDLKQRVIIQKTKLEEISNKFKEIKTLAIEYKKDKDVEIDKLNTELERLKKMIEKNNNLYESMLDKTTQSLEKIISNTESLSKIQ